MASEAIPAPGSLERSIAENVQRFDVLALLDLLRSLGYGSDAIEYRSHMSVTPAALVEAIEFRDSPRSALITVNIGMLSAQSPLPSYLLKLMDEPPEFRFVHFMRFIDHPLVKSRFAALAPERDDAFRPEWERTKSRYLTLLNLKSPSSLGWLFRQVFPELGVTVRRTVEERPVPSAAVQLGVSVLGKGIALGGHALLATNGLEVRLAAEESVAGNGLQWPAEAASRIRQSILPRVEGLELPLLVTLVLRDQESWMRLERGSLLGFEPLVKPDRTSREVRVMDPAHAA